MGLGRAVCRGESRDLVGRRAAVKSDAEGRWVVSVRTPAGSYEPQRITSPAATV
ncbi:MAG: hypothetical protein ACLRMJ_11275 [Alistipes finegoldii]